VSATPPPGYRTQSEDTSYEVEQMLFERWRSMDPAEKAVLVGAASVALQDLTMAGLEQRLPEASRRELELRALALMYGKEVVHDLLGVDVPDESVRIG
jgi:hypothetical protein